MGFKLVALILIIIAVAWLTKGIIKDQRKCNLCNKTMWFFQYVVFRPREKQESKENKMNWRVKESFIPMRHCKCEDNQEDEDGK